MRTAFMVAFASLLEVICIAPGCPSVVNHTEIIFTCAFPFVSFVLSSAAAQKREVGLILGKLFHRIVEPFRTQVRLSSGIRVTGQRWSPFRLRTALYGEVRLRMLCYVNVRLREQCWTWQVELFL